LENTKISLNDKMNATQYKSFAQGFASENQAKYGAAWNEAQEDQEAGAEIL
jgi:hypothetical protein